MFKSLSIIFVAFFVQVVLSQNPTFDGACPDVAPLDTFDVKSFMNVWYGYAKYPFPQVLNRRCIYTNYTYVNEESVVADGYGIDLTTGLETKRRWQVDVLGGGRFAIYYDENQTEGESNFAVLGTDSTNWAVAYNCRNVDGNKHTLEVFILSRTRDLASEYVTKSEELLTAANVDLSYLELYDQKDCPAVQ